MISFRFHLVSLVAVFLALGLGVLTGTTVLNRGIVAQLERQTDQLATQSNELREAVRDLESEVDGWERFGENVSPLVIGERLSGRQVVLVTQEGTSTASTDRALAALQTSGAVVVREITVQDRMAIADDDDREALRGLLGVPVQSSDDELLDRAAERLADQLAFGPGDEDLVEAMAGAGLLTERRIDPPDRSAASPDPAIVVVGGSTDTMSSLPAERFLVPLVERLALDGQAVAAAEDSQVEDGFVAALREGEVADRIVTQDNVDQLSGAMSLIVALESLLAEGLAGHYGVKAGAQEPFPPVS